MIESARRLLLGLGMACAAGAAVPGCSSHHQKPPVVVPTPPPEPPPDPNALPPKGQPVRLDLLVRQTAGRLHYADGRPLDFYQAIQCCGGAGALLGDANTRWPLSGEKWQDLAHSYGANFFHMRFGYWLGDADHETEWADIGGPYKPGSTEWNPAFWQAARGEVWHAHQLNSGVEVVPNDPWWAKVCQWRRETCAVPLEAVDNVGRRPDAEAERLIRKVVEEVGCFAGVIWATDNEGDQIQGEKLSYWEWVADVIRDEEQKSGCGIVHMIGSNSGHDSPKFDFLITHARTPLTAPIVPGKWALNNERNPSLGPDQEAAAFAQAREKGLGWALWLADLQGDKVKRVFELFRDVAKGSANVGCFPAPEDDPRWKGTTGNPPDAVMNGLSAAKAEVGDRRGLFPAGPPEAQFAAMFESLELLAASMRRQGLCAGRSRDAIFAKTADGTKWFELHAVAATDGGYTQGGGWRGSAWVLQ